MTATPPVRPRVLTVGAYERDNVGDLLFLLVTQHYLPECEIVAGAPFASPSMSALLGHEVVPYGEVLGDQDVAAIWSVGGEIGGTTQRSAYQMSKPAEEMAAYVAAPFDERRALLDAAFQGAPTSSPYIPNPAAFPRNAGAFTVVNSAGITGSARLPEHLREELEAVLRTTDAISVRDPESSELLTRLGVEHALVPDVVHALGAVRPGSYDPTSDYAVVQVSTAVLERERATTFGRVLARSDALRGLRLELVLAGTATRHDSFDDMEQLAAGIRRVDPGREIVIRTERHPLEIVDQVRGARVLVSTSLHMRIVAAAYGVPRVTLRRPKTTRYARHWDAEMPYAVRLSKLDDAVASALAAAQRPEVREAADRLVRLADDNVRGLAARLRAHVAAADRRPQLAEARRAAYLDIARRRESCEERTLEVERELDSVRRELAATRAQLAAARELLDRRRGWARVRGALRPTASSEMLEACR